MFWRYMSLSFTGLFGVILIAVFCGYIKYPSRWLAMVIGAVWGWALTLIWLEVSPKWTRALLELFRKK